MKKLRYTLIIACLLILQDVTLFGQTPEMVKLDENGFVELSEEQIHNIVNRSYPYVTMYNVNNKFAHVQGGWNTVVADTVLKDHTMKEIARPNNDTFYIGCMIDVTSEPMIMEIPVINSDYVSLMITGYDHYVNIPLASRLGDFKSPEKLLVYSARTKGYGGENIEGVDNYFEATGDFVSAVIRVMPHSNELSRYQEIVHSMKSVTLTSLSSFQGKESPESIAHVFPPVGNTDADVFENNLLDVMQFVFDHTTFDQENADDVALLEAYKPLGIIPGTKRSENDLIKIDGAKFRDASLQIQGKYLAMIPDQQKQIELQPRIFQPKGKTDLEAVVAVSVIGPIGIPMEEAIYPQISPADGVQLNAMNDYVIRMTKDELPPAKAFWSITLYDLEQGFFIPNDLKKYSVGQNAGMKLNEEGGIEIFIAAEKPEGVPEENWLPIKREDLNISPQLRIYVPDLEIMKNWEPPEAEKI